MAREPREYRQHRFVRPPGACEILFVRHGESAPAVEGVDFELVDGHGDPPLSPLGREQADRVAARLVDEHVDAIYVTTLRRTHETAAPLAAALGIEPVVEPDLREVHLGEWEGGAFRIRVAEQHPIALRMLAEERWDVIPGAEPMDAFAARVRRGVERIASAHPDRRVVSVVHGGVIGEIVRQATGCRPFAFTAADNASITHLVVGADRWAVRRWNDTGHLPGGLDRPPQPLT